MFIDLTFLLLISSFISLWSGKKNSWNNFNFLEFAQVCFLSFHMILGTMMLLLSGIFCMSVNSFCPKIQFKAIISMLTFCPDSLFTSDSEVLKSPTVILLSVSPLRSLITFLMYFHALVLEIYTYIYNLLDVLTLLSVYTGFVYCSCFHCHKLSLYALNLLCNCSIVIFNVLSL